MSTYRIAIFGGVLLAAALAGRPAGAGELEDFHRHFALAAYPTPRHSAEPLGVTGWELFADASLAPDFEGDSAIGPALGEDLNSDALTIVRVGARKGLPGGVDLGLSYAKVLDTEFDLISGELQWAWLKGSAVSPAVAVRLTGTQSRGSSDYELEQYGLDLVASKGFVPLTLFGGAGLVRSDGSFDVAVPGDRSPGSTQEVLFAGLTVRFLTPRLTLEVARTEALQITLRAAVGF